MSYQTVNPATGALVEIFTPIGDYELERVMATAHNTFETDWRKRTVAHRARIISKAASILREEADEFALTPKGGPPALPGRQQKFDI
jgi:succinate-semialdehyde dehydrogenase/glutarate-semialdehyde dehydrogenase